MIKSFTQFINEKLDMDYYDSLLDKWNEFGEAGLSDEEIQYLKSGGNIDIPEVPSTWERGSELSPSTDFN